MKQLLVVFATITLLQFGESCNSHQTTENHTVKSAKATDDTLVNDSSQLVVRDSTGDTLYWRKFFPKKTFSDYSVTEKFTGKIPTKLDFSTCTYGKQFKTATTEALERGAEFAGHYTFAEWGCGSPCQQSSIIDLQTGKVYAGPHAESGYEYRIDSRILVVNPPDSNGLFSPCAYCYPEQYLWTGKEFELLETTNPYTENGKGSR